MEIISFGCILESAGVYWQKAEEKATKTLKIIEQSKSRDTIFDPPLDSGISHAVIVLNQAGIETYESCEGGSGHAYPKPTVRFHGERSEGLRALSVALQNSLPVSGLKRVWCIIDGEPIGPTCVLTFSMKG
jgi:hypothetical protein